MSPFHLDEEAIFDFARRITQPDLRAEYVDQACGTNRELKNRIAERLMACHREQDLRERPPQTLADTTAAPVTERAGDSIGPYKLLQSIGEGGFGVVYRAEQVRPVKRKVAIKIIKPGMDTKDVVARFEAERQALAIMDHPNIAKVFDGGTTNTGRPYFVMELVKGVRITEFCDSNRLSAQQRLKLFWQVCQAIQHAHQKGVIHRDIKPSNVMVTLHDNQPVPKVIDFGVAKAISQELTEKTMFTTYGQMIGTPQYMSPEQAQMAGLDIDTRSDVYSLGVLLYELLTGTTPLDVQQLRNTGYADLQRLICENEPPKPSTKVSGLGDQSVLIAANRGVDASKLRSLLRGDLDWIVMKALEKDRNRRFESAGALAGDIERYLSDQPILARPPSMAYQLQKLVRRNRSRMTVMGLSMVGMVLVAVAIYQQSEIGQMYLVYAAERQKMQEEMQRRAVDDALEAIQNVNIRKLDEAIRRAELAEVDSVLMDILEGRRLLEKEQWQAAVRFLEEALKDNPENVSLNANLVVAYAQQHQVEKCLHHSALLALLTPTSLYDYLFKAEALALTSWGDYSQPLRTIEASLRDYPDCIAAHIVRAKILVKEASVTGHGELIQQALQEIEILEGVRGNDPAIVRLRFDTHAEAAHILGDQDKTVGEEHYQAARRLLSEHAFLSQPHRDLALIDFYEYGDDDQKAFDTWKIMAVDEGSAGGVAGMYGMCAIRQSQGEFRQAVQRLVEVDTINHSADLSCQLGIIAIHAGDDALAVDQYKKADAAQTPFVRLNAQWIALLRGDHESVQRCCRELQKFADQGRMSKWASMDLKVFSGELTNEAALRREAGADRYMAVEGMVSLALLRLSDWIANAENLQARQEAEILLRSAAERKALYFAHYVAEAILHEWKSNPQWPSTSGPK